MKIYDLSGNLLLDVDSDTLCGADLRGADLRGANLRWADLEFARLGCKRFKHDELAGFIDDEIAAMDGGAPDFWKRRKEQLLEMCKAHKN